MTQRLVWPVSPLDLDNLAFIKRETTRLVKEYNEKRHLIQIQKTPEQVLREYRVNISKSRVALIQRMGETNKVQEISSEALALKGHLEAVSSMFTIRKFSKENENQENSESGGKKTESAPPRMVIQNRILRHSVNDSLAKCHRIINLMLSLVRDDEQKSTIDFSNFVNLIGASLLEFDDLIAWCLKETKQTTLPIPTTPVSSLCQISFQKKRKFEGDSRDTAPLSLGHGTNSWCQEMQLKYPQFSFPVNEPAMFSSGLHLTSTSRDIEFHFDLSFDLSSSPLQISLHSIRKDSHSSLPSLVTPFSSPLSCDSHHQSQHISPLLAKMERHLNQMIQAFRSRQNHENENADSSTTSLIERMVVYFCEEIPIVSS
jgi:hypothetical protein